MSTQEGLSALLTYSLRFDDYLTFNFVILAYLNDGNFMTK